LDLVCRQLNILLKTLEPVHLQTVASSLERWLVKLRTTKSCCSYQHQSETSRHCCRQTRLTNHSSCYLLTQLFSASLILLCSLETIQSSEFWDPPYNFCTNRAIRFKFGTDIEDGPLLLPDHKTTPKLAWPGSRDRMLHSKDELLTCQLM